MFVIDNVKENVTPGIVFRRALVGGVLSRTSAAGCVQLRTYVSLLMSRVMLCITPAVQRMCRGVGVSADLSFACVCAGV